MDFARRIHNEAGGKRVCCGFWNKHAHGQPTTVVTINGEVLTKEEATVYVRELDLFETVKLLEDTPAVLSLGKLCEDHGYNYIGPVVRNHISSKMAERSIAIW